MRSGAGPVCPNSSRCWPSGRGVARRFATAKREENNLSEFKTLGLSPKLVDRLIQLKLTDPTPIQSKAIPHVLQGRDVLGLAQTGTGKTAAFGLPILQALMAIGVRPEPKTARALVLAPTRELAKQITEALRDFTQGTHLKVATVTGGVSMGPQSERLARGVDLLVATPGRLIDLIDRRAVRLDGTTWLVLDEADQMLDLGFIHSLRKIASLLPDERQTLLFSATMPKALNEIANSYLTSPIRVEANPPGKAAERIDQSVHFVDQPAKPKLLAELLDQHRDELALVFSRTKHGAEKLMKGLVAAGFAAGSIHGNKSQGQRDRALTAFRNGELRVLVATDVAARGIDIPAVRHVYNFDIPNVPDSYVHRIGRTARAGKSGAAVAFCSPEEFGDLKSIEKLTGEPIRVAGGTAPADGFNPVKKARRGGKPGNATPRPQGKPGVAAQPAGAKRRRFRGGKPRSRMAA
ncbi:MAG: DEAD/DEAH box helicase [Rhodobacteraceae bacterium]|nr:DEAD/DEAH box helicase [Paracoccaceae bacterium]